MTTRISGDTFLSAIVVWMPSSPGILRSLIARSNRCFSASSTATRPLVAVLTSYPCSERTIASMSPMSGSSSMTSTLQRRSGDWLINGRDLLCVACGQPDFHGGSGAFRGLDLDTPAVLDHDLPGQRQPEPGALSLGLRREE